MSHTIDETAKPLRTACMKCGDILTGEAGGENCWCATCKYLLRRPDPPFARYSSEVPSPAVMQAIGLYPSFDDRQLAEPIPSGRHVEHWYDPEEPEYDPAAKFDRIFKRAITAAA